MAPPDRAAFQDLLAKIDFARRLFAICDRHPPRHLAPFDPEPSAVSAVIQTLGRDPRYGDRAGSFSCLHRAGGRDFEDYVTLFNQRVEFSITVEVDGNFLGGHFANLANDQLKRAVPSLQRPPATSRPHFYSLEELADILLAEFTLADDIARSLPSAE